MNLKIVCVYCFLVFSQYVFCQENQTLKSINATSEKVDIRVGTDYFSKGGWHLDPTQNPDVFRIGSKWNYDYLKVDFITDIDSISIDVTPDSQYDFRVLLNNKTPCNIRVLTASNPVFMDWKIILFIGVIFILLSVLLFRINDKENIRKLLLFGLLSPVLFWCFTIVGGFIQGEYDHSRNVISELGTIGSNAEIFTSISLIVISISSLVFSMAFLKASRILNVSKLPSISTFAKPISLVWAAVFPLGNEFHGLMGASPLLLVLGIILSILLWKKESFKTIRIYSIISLFLLLMIFLRFVPSFGQEYEGLIQRFFYMGWTVWFVAIAFDFRKKLKVF